MTGALYARSADLVAAILDAVYDDPEPIPWPDLVHAFTTEATPRKTIENTIYDLVAFGALHRTGRPADRRHADTRALRQTELGRAWLARELLDHPDDRRT
jgi:hypothetical protein